MTWKFGFHVGIWYFSWEEVEIGCNPLNPSQGLFSKIIRFQELKPIYWYT